MIARILSSLMPNPPSRQMAGPQERFGEAGAPLAVGPLGDDDGPELVERALNVLVDDHVIEERIMFDFPLRGRVAPRQGVLGLAGTPAEPPLELLHGGR